MTVKEAIGELYNYDKEPGEIIDEINSVAETEYQRYLRNEESAIYNHEIKYPAEIVQKRMSFVPQGGNWRDIPQELFENNRNNRHSSAF